MKPGDKVFFVILILVVVAISAFWAIRKTDNETDDKIAVIVANGVEIRRINLSQVREPFTFTVEPIPGEYNVIAVEPGRIRVIEASCPNKIDVLTGWISDSSMSIVCAPNRLIIRIEENHSTSKIDGIAY